MVFFHFFTFSLFHFFLLQSYACCDGFAGTSLDEATGKRNTIGCTLVCSSIRQVKVPDSYLLGTQSRNVTSNVLSEGIVIGLPELLDHNATAKCGGSLRLTAPFARLSGAAWYVFFLLLLHSS